jgi:hypothetical protein
LKREDFHTQTWRRLSQLVEDRIDELRQLNDSMSLTVEKTSALRGGISELQKILALADEVSASPVVSPRELAGADSATGQQWPQE